ncbi:hypothetical protein B6D60_09920 [candidate division KSB1 bacterium 4484_87]|nr:MAG: hypothetical protein B6D60_09920 [candidate division KSB1 bacterium 4484_87]
MSKFKSLRGIFRLKFMLLAILIGMASRVAADPFPVITYYFELNENNWKSATINITIENNSQDRLLCILPGISGAVIQSALLTPRVSKFSVTGEGVKDPTFQKVNENSWLIHTNGNRTIVISYSISKLENIFLGKYFTHSYALIDNPAIFMIIRELKNYPVRLTISVPYGWKLATSLPFAGDNFEYSALNYEQLAQHPLFLAPFQEIYFTYYNQIHFVLYNKNISSTLSDKISKFSQKIFRSQCGFFGTIPKDRYFFIFNFLKGKNPITFQSFDNGSIFFLPRQFESLDYPILQRKISSGLFSHWFRNIRPSVENIECQMQQFKNLWFWHGAAEYYGALFLTKSGEWSEEFFINYLIGQINQLQKIQNANKTPISRQQLTGQGSAMLEASDLIRLKGELLCLVLDLKIRDVTQNKKSLNDIVKFIHQWSELHVRGMEDANLLEIINSVTNVDFTTFFDLYIDGVIEMPLADALNKAGIFVESRPDTVPDVGNVTIEKNIITNFDRFSPLALAGVKKGDRVIAINQFQIQSYIDTKILNDSLHVGKGNELMVSREGLSLLLSLNVPGRTIRQTYIVSKEPKTDFQAAIRKKWLTGSME